MLRYDILVSRQDKQSQRVTLLFILFGEVLLTIAGSIKVGVEHFDQS